MEKKTTCLYKSNHMHILDTFFKNSSNVQTFSSMLRNIASRLIGSIKNKSSNNKGRQFYYLHG